MCCIKTSMTGGAIICNTRIIFHLQMELNHKVPNKLFPMNASNRGFQKLIDIANTVYWHQRLYYLKLKNCSNRVLPPVKIKLGTPVTPF